MSRRNGSPRGFRPTLRFTVRTAIPKGTVYETSFNCVKIYFPTPEHAEAFQKWLEWMSERTEPATMRVIPEPETKVPTI